MAIRWKLTLWFSLIVLAILVATSIALYFLLDRYLTGEADLILESYTSRVHGALLPLSIDEPVDYNVVHSQLPPINEFSSPGVYLQLIDETGAVVVRSNNLINQALPAAPAATAPAFSGRASFATVSSPDGARVRILATPLYLRDRTLVLEVAQSLKMIDTTMSSLRLALSGGVLAAVVLVAVSGFFTLKRALGPVQRITRIARDIETGADLSRRVGQTGAADEIGQLAATFDHMIERLDAAFTSQRKFVADASHELRSPLTVIRGNLDLIRRNPDRDNVSESLRAAEAETNRMSQTVAELLVLAELEAEQQPRREPMRMDRVVNEELARVRSLAVSRQIKADILEPLIVRGDDHRIRQLLGNLLDNAIKHTPEDATITVSLRREGGWARLDVSDTGPGIDAEHIPHVFDRFYRADKSRSRSSGGTGLGLAIVRGIAEQHGGTVAAASEPGRGTTFTVRLPIASQKPGG